MFMMILKNVIKVGIAITSLTVSSFAAEAWMTNFEEAKKKAVLEKKDLLVDFTGSDWCHWCIQLDKEVFQKAEFKGADKFILVELDYPNDKSKQSEEEQKQNADLAQKYQVQGFPTVLLMDSKGRPYARTGYQAGGAEVYNKHLDKLLKVRDERDKKFTMVAEVETKEAKAEALEAALKCVAEVNPDFYKDEYEQLNKLDPNNFFVEMEKVVKKFEVVESDESYQKAVESLEAFAKNEGLKGEELQKIQGLKIDYLMKKKDFDGVEKVLDAMIAIDPEGEMSKMIKRFKEEGLPQMRERAAGK